MNPISLHLDETKAAFVPGMEIGGQVAWRLTKPDRKLELRLFWFTRGKGTEDVQMVETVVVENPGDGGSRPFRFRLPAGPYSFSGRLISLVWAVEAVASPSKESARIEFVMGPDGREVLLPTEQPAQLLKALSLRSA